MAGLKDRQKEEPSAPKAWRLPPGVRHRLSLHRRRPSRSERLRASRLLVAGDIGIGAGIPLATAGGLHPGPSGEHRKALLPSFTRPLCRGGCLAARRSCCSRRTRGQLPLESAARASHRTSQRLRISARRSWVSAGSLAFGRRPECPRKSRGGRLSPNGALASQPRSSGSAHHHAVEPAAFADIERAAASECRSRLPCRALNAAPRVADSAAVSPPRGRAVWDGRQSLQPPLRPPGASACR